MGKKITGFVLGVLLGIVLMAANAVAGPSTWRYEWPETDFTKTEVDFDEILSGGPPKDGIPAIDNPKFTSVAEASKDLVDTEPVIGLIVGDEAKAYPLRVLTWHEIANDTIGGVPVAVTYCPLCNAAIVFDRRVGARVLDFGTTGKLRNSDLVMYDRQTESWWQQFAGRAIVGGLTGTDLVMIPSRLESFASFRARAPQGRVLVPNNPRARRYGDNPYVGYDSEDMPFLYRGEMPKGIEPMARVVAVGDEAWPLDLLRKKGEVRQGALTLRWTAGQNSALDSKKIAKGRDVGNVVVIRTGRDGQEAEAVHHVTFAFVFHAFKPKGTLHLN